jgi:hypothetical protein
MLLYMVSYFFLLYNPIDIIRARTCQALVAWCLPLEAWCLLLDAFKKLFTAAQVAGRKRAMVLYEPWQQVIMFNSLHLISSFSPCPASPAAGSLPMHPLFFLMQFLLLYHHSYVLFLSKYILHYPGPVVKLEACGLKLAPQAFPVF